MIYIVTLSKEYSTDRIIDWLRFFKLKEFNRLCLDILEYPAIELNSFIYKRKISIPKFNSSSFDTYVKKELKFYWYELFESIDSDKLLGSRSSLEPSKSKMLKLAKSVGYLVPNYVITCDKNVLMHFIDIYKEVITKPLAAPQNIIDNIDIAFRASIINRKDVEQLNENFYPTFLQEMVPRDYEIRLFYLNGTCWSMAFVVKKENEVSPDIWNIEKRREVPIVTPKEIQEKTRKFMTLAGYNTGSLDFIIRDKDYYFLEINPVGQFGMVSKPCNYYLEKLIAKFLIKKNG